MLKSLRWFVPALAACALPQLAFAHALLVRSNPAANAVVHGPNLSIDLKFNSRIDAAHCLLSLTGVNVPAHELTIEHAPASDELVAHTQGLHPGTYQLRWQALSVDGHITRGEIPFRVE